MALYNWIFCYPSVFEAVQTWLPQGNNFSTDIRKRFFLRMLLKETAHFYLKRDQGPSFARVGDVVPGTRGLSRESDQAFPNLGMRWPNYYYTALEISVPWQRAKFLPRKVYSLTCDRVTHVSEKSLRLLKPSINKSVDFSCLSNVSKIIIGLKCIISNSLLFLYELYLLKIESHTRYDF